jgi:hypothetical protein
MLKAIVHKDKKEQNQHLNKVLLILEVILLSMGWGPSVGISAILGEKLAHNT